MKPRVGYTFPYAMTQPDFASLAAKISYLSASDLDDVRQAFDFAVEAHNGQVREDGTPYVLHVIAVAEIVAGWHADRDTLVACLLHDTIEDTPVRKEDIAQKFGRKVALLVEGITKFTQADLSPDLPLDRKIETLRKLFDVMRVDIRSILIKLADRVHNVETIDSLPTPERRRRFALETLNVYYKLAYHLGMREVRRTFAEYCVPHAFDNGAEEKRKRDLLCLSAKHIVPVIEKELRKQEDSDRIVDVFFRPDNLLLFHEKAEERGGNPILQDAFFVSVIVRTEEDCYHLLKILHTLYRPVSGQFRDYIAAPSDAGYQSLHTHVAMRDGAVIEVRIRTPEMYEQAMRGLTLFLYKSKAATTPNFSWLKRSELLDIKTRDSSNAFWEALESDILRETISAIVDRRRMSLPKGATALDAAYALYDSRAGSVSSLTVNGRTVPGSEILREDDDVHVTLDQGKRVTFDWLQMVSTRHARLLIVDVLKQTDKSEKIALGASLLQKELDHYNKGLISEFSRSQCQLIADYFRRESFDQVLSMIGEGVIRARDVVFFLYPERGDSFFRLRKSTEYSFRLRITATVHDDQDVLSDLQNVMKDSNVTARNIQLRPMRERGTVEIFLGGTCSDRLAFADFVEVLERKDWISQTESMLSTQQRAMVMALFGVAFALILLDVLLFPLYQSSLLQLSRVPQVIVQALPLIPILVVNYYLLRILRHYVVRIRSDRWFLGIGLFLNIIGLMLLVLRMVLLQDAQSSLLPLIAIFVLAFVYTGYKFFQTETLFVSLDERSIRPISEHQWKDIRAQKIKGYGIRLLAVLIWGLQPLYIRYTPVSELSVLLRTFLLGVGVLVISSVFLLLRHLFSRSKMSLVAFRLPYGKYFSLLVVGQITYMTLKNASLVYTSGTNFLLFGNFAPLLGLLVAAIFWRKEIAYLRRPQTMLWIFLLAVVTGIGSSLLMYNNSLASSTGVIGDVLAFIAAGFDVLLVVAQIQYIKQFPRTDAALLNLYLFFFFLCVSAPIIVFGSLLGWPVLHDLTRTTLLLGIALGVFEGVGQMCNYEAFKRIDGYLAFMMFNLSILITFVLEAFVIHSIRPSFLLLLSGAIIIGASVIAEIVNSRCQKKGL